MRLLQQARGARRRAFCSRSARSPPPAARQELTDSIAKWQGTFVLVFDGPMDDLRGFPAGATEGERRVRLPQARPATRRAGVAAALTWHRAAAGKGSAHKANLSWVASFCAGADFARALRPRRRLPAASMALLAVACCGGAAGASACEGGGVAAFAPCHPQLRRAGTACRRLGSRLRAEADGTHYEAMGVSQRASEGEIRSAYLKLAKRLHPDVSTDPSDVARFQRIAEAYEVLSDGKRRAVYDQVVRHTQVHTRTHTYSGGA